MLQTFKASVTFLSPKGFLFSILLGYKNFMLLPVFYCAFIIMIIYRFFFFRPQANQNGSLSISK